MGRWPWIEAGRTRNRLSRKTISSSANPANKASCTPVRTYPKPFISDTAFPGQSCRFVSDKGGMGPTYKSACHDIELSNELMSRSGHQLQHGAQSPNSQKCNNLGFVAFSFLFFQRAHRGEAHHQVISRGPSNRDEANFPFPNRRPPF